MDITEGKEFEKKSKVQCVSEENLEMIGSNSIESDQVENIKVLADEKNNNAEGLNFVDVDKNKKSTILKNYMFNVLYQLFLILVPIIVTPYVSRVLQPEGVGQFSFSSSIITYFTIFAALGCNLYGQREISKYQGDKHKQSVVFYEIFIVRIFSTFLVLALNLILCAFNIYGAYNTLMWILSINIFAVIFDFSFVLQGNEAFGKLVLRNIIVRSLSVASIFIFVKSADDVWVYTLITAITLVVSNLAIIFYLRNMIERVSFRELKPSRNIVPVLRFFIPTIVISIYTILDKTLIGVILHSDAQNGYYEQAYKIVSVAVTLVTALSLVMVSRNSYEKHRGNSDKLKSNVYFASQLVMFIGFPIMFGVMAVAQNINLWFFGPGYNDVIVLMIFFAPLIMAIGLNNVTGIQYMMAVGRENTFTITVLVGAILNCILNLILIYAIGVLGAVIASVVAETAILLLQLFILRNEISVKKFLFSGWKCFLSSIVMFAVLWFIKDYFESSILNTSLLVVIGVVIYGVMVLILRENTVKSLIQKILKKEKADYDKKNSKKADA